jgi:hypothetical protein
MCKKIVLFAFWGRAREGRGGRGREDGGGEVIVTQFLFDIVSSIEKYIYEVNAKL